MISSQIPQEYYLKYKICSWILEVQELLVQQFCQKSSSQFSCLTCYFSYVYQMMLWSALFTQKGSPWVKKPFFFMFQILSYFSNMSFMQ